MNIYKLLALCGVLVSGYVVKATTSDTQIRSTTYSEPLKNMPENAGQLILQMMDTAIRDARESGNALADAEISAKRLEFSKMLAQGAVAQRNLLMALTRTQISYLGQFLSWYMKAKGKTYAQIEEKFAKDFSADDHLKYEAIIQSASRANKDVFGKLVGTLRAKL